jgi:hypothetical protein
VESGCESPSAEDKSAGGGSLVLEAEGGGCEVGTSRVVGVVATVRENEDGDGRRVTGRRNRRLRWQEVQSMTVTLEERMGQQCYYSYSGICRRKKMPGRDVVANSSRLM